MDKATIKQLSDYLKQDMDKLCDEMQILTKYDCQVDAELILEKLKYLKTEWINNIVMNLEE